MANVKVHSIILNYIERQSVLNEVEQEEIHNIVLKIAFYLCILLSRMILFLATFLLQCQTLYSHGNIRKKVKCSSEGHRTNTDKVCCN